MSNSQRFSYWGGVLYGTPLLLFGILTWSYDFNGLFGQDSHAYYQYAQELKLYLTTGKTPGNFYWPKLYPFLGAIISTTGMHLLTVMRLLSLLSLLGVIFYTNKIIQEIYHKDGKLWLFLGLVLSTYFIRGGMLVMSDMLATFLVVFCYWSFVRFMNVRRVSFLLVMVVTACAAFFVRYPTLPLVFVPILIAVIVGLRKVKYNWLIAVLFLVGMLSVLLVYYPFFKYITDEFFRRWSFSNIFSRSLKDNDGQSFHWVPNSIYVFGNLLHIGYLAIGVFLLPFYKKIKGISLFFLIGVCGYLAFISGFSTQNYRFLMLSHPLIMVLLFPAFLRFWSWLKNKKLHWFFVGGTVLFNVMFFIYSFGKTYRVHQNEKEIVLALQALHSKATIYSFYVDQSFLSYGIENEVKNLYLEEYKTFEKGSLLIFNVTKFQKQWEGTTVMKNWNKVTQEYQLEELVSFQNHWKIYRIQ
ncbi:MAG: hypothetical protein N4A35_04395 [Flavobacteriales bacterium]|jgi:hypothetical protein|nr:hypothetical protein [Flavobacteriales bacterium]